MSLFGSSGIRAQVDRSLLLFMLDLGLAIGSLYRPVVLGRDARTSSGAVGCSLCAGLLAGGSVVHDAGVVPTPTLAYVSRKFAAGTMVTASHNPPGDNGVKLWNPDGSAFDSSQRKALEDRIASISSVPAPWEKMGEVKAYGGALEEHISGIVADFPGPFKLRVVVDSACGATSLATPYLLKRMGCEVIALDSYPSGFPPRSLEPTPESLGNLMKAVVSFDADLGIAHDGDGDRMVTIDETGRFVSGDKLLVLLAKELGASKVVTTVDASMIVEEHGMGVVRTKVGDAFVSEELKKGGDFGGEPAGAWIFPRISLCPDGMYAAAFLVSMVAARGELSRQVEGLPSYPILRGSLRGDRAVMPLLEKRLKDKDSSSLSLVDGIRLGFKDGWVLVRSSGTEQKIRITAEGRDSGTAERYYSLGLAAVKASLEERERGKN